MHVQLPAPTSFPQTSLHTVCSQPHEVLLSFTTNKPLSPTNAVHMHMCMVPSMAHGQPASGHTHLVSFEW